MTHRELNAVADGVWEICDELRMPMFVRFPIRMTVLRAESGRLVLISPIRLDDTLVAAIDQLGEVEHIVAPNLMHHLFASAARERWPRARLWGAPGLKKKRSDLSFHSFLAAGALVPGLAVFPLAGAPAVEEHAFLHHASRTLVVTDLVFNVRAAPNFMTRWVFKWVSGTYGRLAPSRLWKRFAKDRTALKQSLAAVLDADFDRLVVAHGDVVQEGAQGSLRAALSAFLSPR